MILAERTMRGVTQRVCDAYRNPRGEQCRSARQIIETELQAVYRRQY
jgi:lysozyme family protein